MARGVYPEKLTQAKELEYAASKLTSIEINGTYYGSQKPESFRKWAREVPDGFVFSLKGPRFATDLRKSSQRPATKHFHFADRACYRREQLKTTIRNFTMKYAFALLGAAALLASFSSASAQTAEPTYKADPDVYKIIYEDEKVRIIESTRKAGVTDKLHGHPVKSIVYGVTQCKTEQTADGKTTETDTKPGTARALPVIPAHTAKNIGSEDCKQLFVELK